MSVFRVNKTKDYVTMSKTHLKEKNMSLKAKGLLSEMLGLPNEWDYSINGLVSINKENESAIKSTLAELKEFGYLKVTKLLPNATTSGRIEYIYDIYENPLQEGKKQEVENQPLENQPLENQSVENPTQLNNKELSNKELSNKELKRGKKFIKPTIEQIQEYCLERSNGVNAEAFYDFYESKDWYVGKNKMKDWKACVRTWEQRKKEEKKKSTDFDRPSWLDMDL
jgi:hypothetical protein